MQERRVGDTMVSPENTYKIPQNKEVKLPCVTPFVTDRCFLPDLAELSYYRLRRT